MQSDTQPEDVLRFWIDEVGPDGWYAGTPEIDEACAARFGQAWEAARGGAFRAWASRPEGALAYLILTDQIPRNIRRGTAQAFATDPFARAAATQAVAKGFDLHIEGLPRQFFYLPFEHAETPQHQSRSVCLFLTRMPEDPGGNLVHARAHREIIRRFGRFPSRNAALGRVSTAAETAWLAEGGYAALVRELGG